MPVGRVALLVIDNDFCRIVACYLAEKFPDLTVIIERRISRRLLLQRRIKRRGLAHVVGQVAFMFYAGLLARLSRNRIRQILEEHRLESNWPEAVPLIHVPSVNSAECIAHLHAIDPQVVLVVGTRILTPIVLSAVAVPFINYHNGITPKYRGIHGGYWAKVQDDAANFGVTVHLIDQGIDTGDVVYQTRLTPGLNDNYATYPYLQLAAGLPLLEEAAKDAIADNLSTQKLDLPSRLWSHPTLWSYVATGLRRGVW
jgi:hypothetical protein